MSHQRRLSSPPASALPDRYADTVTTSSSAPSHVGEWDSHQLTSRISWLGSASGSQPGQYARATHGMSGRQSATDLWRVSASPFISHSGSDKFNEPGCDPGTIGNSRATRGPAGI